MHNLPHPPFTSTSQVNNPPWGILGANRVLRGKVLLEVKITTVAKGSMGHMQICPASTPRGNQGWYTGFIAQMKLGPRERD